MESRENPNAPSQEAGSLTRTDAKSNDQMRLARALRENLQRRKTQKRERRAPDGKACGETQT